MKKLPVSALVGGVAVLWGVLLILVWAIHPVESSAKYAPIENPSAAEQASIDDVFEEFDGAQPVLSNQLQCSSSPLQAATGDSGASPAPSLPAGFEYVEAPCSSAYSAASAALWINALVIGAIVVASGAIHLRMRRRSPDTTSTTETSPAESHVKAELPHRVDKNAPPAFTASRSNGRLKAERRR